MRHTSRVCLLLAVFCTACSVTTKETGRPIDQATMAPRPDGELAAPRVLASGGPPPSMSAEELFDDPQVSYPEGRDTLIGTWRFSAISTEGKGGFTKTYQFFPATGVVLGGVDRDDGGHVIVIRSRPPPPLPISPFTFSMVDFSETNQLGTPVCSVYDFNVVSQNQLYGAVLMYTGTEAGCRESPIESITHYILSAERIE